MTDFTNRGILFPNTIKRIETHPDYRGTINIAGRDYWLSAWHGETKDGDPKLSLRCRPKEDRRPTIPSPTPKVAAKP